MPVCGKHMIKKSLVYSSPIQKKYWRSVCNEVTALDAFSVLYCCRQPSLEFLPLYLVRPKRKVLGAGSDKRNVCVQGNDLIQKIGNAPKFRHGFLCFYNLRNLVAPKEACWAKWFSTPKLRHGFACTQMHSQHCLGCEGA